MNEKKESDMGVLATFRALRNVSGYALWGTSVLMFGYLAVVWVLGIAMPEAAKTALYLTNGVLMTVGTLNVLNERVDTIRVQKRINETFRKLQSFSDVDQKIIFNIASLGHAVSPKSKGNPSLLALVEMGVYKISEYDPRDQEDRLFVITDLGMEALMLRFVPWFSERDQNINLRLKESLSAIESAIKNGDDKEKVGYLFNETVDRMKSYYGGRRF